MRAAALTLVLAAAACGPSRPAALPITLVPRMTAEPFQVPEAPPERWLGGGRLEARDLAGKVVFIELWAYQCEWCDHAHAWVRDLARRYGPRLVILGVHSPQSHAGEHADAVARYAREQGMTWPIYFDRELSVMDGLRAEGWPTFLLVDRAGRIRLRTLGNTEAGSPRARGIEAAIDELLAERR